MDRLLDWYWQYGINRGNDPNDPDRELRKISIGGWLDPLVRILERRRDISANAGNKACLALWGPSQTGKSTMLSQFVDGKEADGSDSALTWSTQKTRFSPALTGQPDSSLIFNPHNHQSDASGVATRYTLQSAAAGHVHPDFPVEIKLTNRSQLILSIALGYQSECERVGEYIVFTQDSFLGHINVPEMPVLPPQREAYLLLNDIANAIEFMRGHSRFSNLFRRSDEWDRHIRPALVSSPTLIGNVTAAEEILAKIFWDGDKTLTKFFRDLLASLNHLQRDWQHCRILASLEVGALLLDIDSYANFANPDGKTINKDKVKHLIAVREGNEIHISIDKDNLKSDERIAGSAFGYFQALCAELTVPLKQEAIAAFPEKKEFLRLLERCDFLDFPGVSNKNTGNATGDGNAELIQLNDQTSPCDLLTKVFKQGKTQCFVCNYVRRYGIDAFAILMRTDRSPSQTSLLNAGIKDWLCSYDSTWTPGRPAPMPIFLNLTFFSALLDDVALNGTGNNGLSAYVERIHELNFARRESARFFATTYQQFRDGRIYSPDSADNTIAEIQGDPQFIPATAISEENLRAVYAQDGGLSHLFSQMADKISASTRRSKCSDILRFDCSKMHNLLTIQLPGNDNQQTRRDELQTIVPHFEKCLKQIEEEEDNEKYVLVAQSLNALFSVSAKHLDPLPQAIGNFSLKKMNTYIREQLGKWCEEKVTSLKGDDFLTAEQQQLVVHYLRDAVDMKLLRDFLIKHYPTLNSQEAKLARSPFALALGNVLRTGAIELKSDADFNNSNPETLKHFIKAKLEKDSKRDSSPYYQLIIAPLLDRLKQLANTISSGERPPQPGDDELLHLRDSLMQENPLNS